MREGSDVTLVTSQRMVSVALEASAELMRESVSCEIIDPRTFVPLDMENHPCIDCEDGAAGHCRGGCAVHAAGGRRSCSRAADEALWTLDAPATRVTMGDSIIPFSEPLEQAVLPGVEEVISAVRC